MQSTQDGSCCSEADFSDATYREVLGAESWQAQNETRLWNAIVGLAQTPPGRDFKTGVHALAYDKGWSETDSRVELIATQVLAALDGFARLFPRRRWYVGSYVDNVGPKNCGPYPVWAENMTPQAATFDAGAKAALLTAVPNVPASYLAALQKSGTLDYLRNLTDAYRVVWGRWSASAVPPPKPILDWLVRAVIVINSDPFAYKGAGWVDGTGLVGYRRPVLPEDMLTISATQITMSPWLKGLCSVFPSGAMGAGLQQAIDQMKYAPAPVRTRPVTMKVNAYSTATDPGAGAPTGSGPSKLPWIALLVGAPIVVTGGLWFAHKRGWIGGR